MVTTAENLEKGRLTASDWIRAALEVIAETGINGVAVEPLAKRLGVTKGSFYWHFSTRDELIAAALAHWESEDQEELKKVVEENQHPQERLRELFRVGGRGHEIHTVYSALFSTVDHPLAAPVMERVTERRLNYLIHAFQALGMHRVQAQHRARLTYSAYVGFLQLARQRHGTHMKGEEFEAYVEHMMETLIPDSGSPVPGPRSRS